MPIPTVQINYDPNTTNTSIMQQNARQQLLMLLPLSLLSNEPYVIRFHEETTKVHSESTIYMCWFDVINYTDYYNIIERGKT